jgi:hypothetical protein
MLEALCFLIGQLHHLRPVGETLVHGDLAEGRKQRCAVGERSCQYEATRERTLADSARGDEPDAQARVSAALARAAGSYVALQEARHFFIFLS